MVTLRDRVGEIVLVIAKLVGMELRDLVKLRDLDCVTETVPDLVGKFDAGTVKRGLGDTVTERVLVLTKLEGMELGDLVKLRELDRVTETVPDLVAWSEAGTVKRGLGDTVTERVLVGSCEAGGVKSALGDLVKLRDLDCVTETVAEGVAKREAGTVKRGLGDTVTERVLVLTKLVGMGLRDIVKLRDFDRVKETVTEMVMLPVLVAMRVVGAGEGDGVNEPVWVKLPVLVT